MGKKKDLFYFRLDVAGLHIFSYKNGARSSSRAQQIRDAVFNAHTHELKQSDPNQPYQKLKQELN
jgi:hypothetical protein